MRRVLGRQRNHPWLLPRFMRTGTGGDPGTQPTHQDELPPQDSGPVPVKREVLIHARKDHGIWWYRVTPYCGHAAHSDIEEANRCSERLIAESAS